MKPWNDPRKGSPTSSTAQAYPPRIVIPTTLTPIHEDAAITFGRVGPLLQARGWSAIPQTAGYDGKDRQPGTTLEWTDRGQARRMIRYKKRLELHKRLPTPEEVALWIQDGNARLNSALVPGDSPGSFGWFSIDLDILDSETAAWVIDCADRKLGRTPILRGRPSSPKAALFYRRKLGALRLPDKDFRLVDDHEGQQQVIEIKDDGLLITGYGHHHSSREPYIYLRETEPAAAGPEVLPETDEEQILDFLGEVHGKFGIRKYGETRKAYAASPVQWADTDISDMRVPKMPEDMDRSSKIVDDRKAWLFRRSVPWARHNAGIVAPLENGMRRVDNAGVQRIAAAIYNESIPFIDYDTSGKKLSQTAALRLIAGHVRSAAEKMAKGGFGYDPIGTRRIDPKTKIAEPEILDGVVQTDDEYAWLPVRKDRQRLPVDRGGNPILTRTEPNTEAATAVALVMDRVEIMQSVARKLRAALWAYFDEVWAAKEAGEDAPLPPAHLLMAPTGAGKTTMAVKVLAEWKAAHPDRDLGPVLLLMPSYGNMNEIAARGDLGVWTKEDEKAAQQIIAEAEGLSLQTLVFRGKIAAGCQVADKVKLLQRAGVSSSGLCEKEVLEEQYDDEGNKHFVEVTRYCPFHPDHPNAPEKPCQAILQRRDVPTSDLILAAHAYVTTTIPKVLKEHVSAVIIDERVWDKTIGVSYFPLKNLLRTRPEPRLTKKEKDAGEIDPVDRVETLREVGHVLHGALVARKDLAKAILDMENGKQKLADALWVTGRLQSVVMDVRPDTTLETIADYVGDIKHEHLWEQHRLLKLVQERVTQLNLSQSSDLTAAPKGETDLRIALVEDGKTIRVSWRKEKNFGDKPILWLDASGKQEILERIWGRDIGVTTIEAPLFARCVWVPDATYAKSRILPDKDDKGEVVLAKARTQILLQEAFTGISLMYSEGAVAFAAALEIRKHLQSKWLQPSNLHAMHYGAVRGLDFAKHHLALVSVGQIELRPQDLDAYVGALTFDLDEPELPTDPLGTGKDADGNPLKRRHVPRQQPLRDGGFATVHVYEPEGRWACMIVEQVREEELAQFLGRLRPVYRSGRAPTWFHFGRVLPRDVVVDEIITLEDLARPFGRTLPVFHDLGLGGVLTPASLGSPYASAVSDTAVAKAHALFCNSDRANRSFFELSYNDHAGVAQRAFVPGHIADPVGQLQGAIEASDIRVVREPRPVEYRTPATDKVEEALGPVADRVAAVLETQQHLVDRIEQGYVKFDDERRGIAISARAQAPHLFLAHEAMMEKIEELKGKAKAASIEALNPGQYMIEDLEAEGVAVELKHLDGDAIDLVMEHFALPDDLRARVREIRASDAEFEEKLKPVEVSFDQPIKVPVAANSADPVPSLPANVVRFPRPFGGLGFNPTIKLGTTPV